MAQLKFIGASIRMMDYRAHKDGSTFARLDMSADFTPKMAEMLGIEDMLEIDSAKGLVPVNVDDVYVTEAKLVKQGFEGVALDTVANKVSDFKVRKLEDEGVSSREIQFHLWLPGAAGKLAIDYVEAIRTDIGVLTVTKSANQSPDGKVLAMQGTIDGGEEPITDGAGKRRKRGRPATAAEVAASVE